MGRLQDLSALPGVQEISSLEVSGIEVKCEFEVKVAVNLNCTKQMGS